MAVIEEQTPPATAAALMVPAIDLSLVQGDAVIVAGHVVSVVAVRESEVLLRIEPRDQFAGFDIPQQTAGLRPGERRVLRG